jgi:hypothetical protein
MPGPLIVGAEGVILLPDKEAYASSRPIQEGLELVLMLKDFPTSSHTVICRTKDQTAAEYFMKMNGLPKADVILTAVEDENEHPAIAQWHAINRARARGPVNLVITAHREVFERCTQSSQPVMLYGRRGALSTLDAQTSWEEIHSQVRATKEIRLDDEAADTGRRE